MLLNDIVAATLKNDDPFVRRVCDIYCEEVALRSGIALKKTDSIPGKHSFILFTTLGFLKKNHLKIYNMLPDALPEPNAEGFIISVKESDGITKIIVAGADGRGCFYGMARVLRKMYMKTGVIKRTSELINMSLTPKYQIRGHQLAYRDKQNTCSCWDTGDFDRYIRDLAFFGTNAIEILPPRTDDNLFSSVFLRDPFEMMLELSRIIHSYYMDVWLWYPHMGADYKDPDVYNAELAEREKVFSQIPYVDAVFIPAGDPGSLHPADFFAVSGDCVKILHKYHPEARVWISPQSSAPAPGWYDAFYSEVDKEPFWLYGLCFAPWVRDTIYEMRDRLPDKYKNRIRHYPDITHSSSSQFEAADWDIPFALTLGREGNNARPKAMKHIHNLHAPYTVGSITYSEGVHDDVNKMVWGDQDFNPNMPAEETLRDYTRLFIDPDAADSLAELLLKTEDNWKGYAKENENIDAVYNGFVELEKTLPDAAGDNYRFQMALLRAFSDYQAKLRCMYDARLEEEALAELAAAVPEDSRIMPETGAAASTAKEECAGATAIRTAETIKAAAIKTPETIKAEVTADAEGTAVAGAASDAAPISQAREAIRKARAIFRRTFDEPVNNDLNRRIQQLADSLYEKIKIKLTTTRHFGQSWIRGAYLDSLALPLNDYQWYMTHFSRIWDMPLEKDRLTAIKRLLTRTDPGEGGFYDWLGDIGTFAKRVVRDLSWEEDPGHLRSPVVNHDPYGIQMLMHRMRGWYDEFPVTLRWVARARVIYGSPLKVRYSGLDPDAGYIIRLCYPIPASAKTGGKRIDVRFTAGGHLIHDHIILTPVEPTGPGLTSVWNPIYEYALPKASYDNGDLDLVWRAYGRLNAFCVSEIWIIKR